MGWYFLKSVRVNHGIMFMNKEMFACILMYQLISLWSMMFGWLFVILWYQKYVKASKRWLEYYVTKNWRKYAWYGFTNLHAQSSQRQALSWHTYNLTIYTCCMVVHRDMHAYMPNRLEILTINKWPYTHSWHVR